MHGKVERENFATFPQLVSTIWFLALHAVGIYLVGSKQYEDKTLGLLGCGRFGRWGEVFHLDFTYMQAIKDFPFPFPLCWYVHVTSQVPTVATYNLPLPTSFIFSFISTKGWIMSDKWELTLQPTLFAKGSPWSIIDDHRKIVVLQSNVNWTGWGGLAVGHHFHLLGDLKHILEW